jgi:signal transduction histidine kinase
MTRRIALAILLTVWTTLIVGGSIVYLATRTVLLADLDANLLARVSALPELWGDAVDGPPPHSGDRFIVRNEAGRTVQRSPFAAPPMEPPRIIDASFTRLGDGERLRTITLSVTVPADEPDEGPERLTVVYSGSAERFDAVLSALAGSLLVFGLVAGAAGAAVAVVVARSALRPLRSAAETVGAIDERALDRRIDADALPQEMHPIAMRLNEMLERLERSFAQRKQFLADAAHELRTPIAALVTALEVSLRRPRTQLELQETVEQCMVDARLLQQLAQRLLEHARSDRPGDPEEAEVVALPALLQECAEVLKPLSARKQVAVQQAVDPAAKVTAAPGRLRSVVLNLLSNAIEHSPTGGAVELSGRMNNGMVTISVRDRGRGIAPEHLPHVFEPFYRGDAARSHEDGHLGLGLFLVRSHVQAMQGQCRVESRPGEGTEIVVSLPCCFM